MAKDTISDSEIANLDPKRLNQMDRWALNQNTTDRNLYKNIADYGLVPLVLSPAFLLINKKIRKDWFNLTLMYAEGHSVVFSFYNYSPLGPTFQNKYRPMTYYDEFPMHERESGNNRNSFYSGHVATATFTSFFMAKVYFDYHPEIGAKKYLLYTLALIPAIGMSYIRTKSLDHFPSDDAVGFILGAALGIIIPDLHHIHAKNVTVGMYSPPHAMGLSVRWVLAGKQKLRNISSLNIDNSKKLNSKL